VISHGLSLTKFTTAHLIGVDPNYRIHVSDGLLEIYDGPFLELGLKGIAGTLVVRPNRIEDRPDRDRLAIRFERFAEGRIVSIAPSGMPKKDADCCDKWGTAMVNRTETTALGQPWSERREWNRRNCRK